jgi:hypothetical protein
LNFSSLRRIARNALSSPFECPGRPDSQAGEEPPLLSKFNRLWGIPLGVAHRVRPARVLYVEWARSGEARMSIDKLVQQLEKQPKTVEEHFAEKRDEWVADVAKLMRDVAEWLRPAIEKGLVKIDPYRVKFDEPDSGAYDIDALTIHLGEREVHMTPRGMRVVGVVPSGGKRIVGARGRVDLVSGPARATILRKSDRTWQLATVDGWSSEKEAVPLTQETMTDALGELIA